MTCMLQMHSTMSLADAVSQDREQLQQLHTSKQPWSQFMLPSTVSFKQQYAEHVIVNVSTCFQVYR